MVYNIWKYMARITRPDGSYFYRRLEAPQFLGTIHSTDRYAARESASCLLGIEDMLLHVCETEETEGLIVGAFYLSPIGFIQKG